MSVGYHLDRSLERIIERTMLAIRRSQELIDSTRKLLQESQQLQKEYERNRLEP